MTYKPTKKIRQNMVNWPQILLLVAGALEGLLLARLIARLLAARPDNPAFALLLRLTDPLVAPLRALDYDQPPFGAAFEFSTLTMAIVVPLVAYLAWLLLTRAATDPAG
jgi:uncharacterized protein YggT (Ycf19 family)